MAKGKERIGKAIKRIGSFAKSCGGKSCGGEGCSCKGKQSTDSTPEKRGVLAETLRRIKKKSLQ